MMGLLKKRVILHGILITKNKFCLLFFFFQELPAAKKQFEIIVIEHKNVVFPLAYLGIGRVFYKQNRCELRFFGLFPFTT